MIKELKAILEYDAARIAVRESKRTLPDLLENCAYSPYMHKDGDNCIRLMRKYAHWEKYSGREHHPSYCMDEPEFRSPCDNCQKALAVFEDITLAKKRLGIAKTRLSRIARDCRNKEIIAGEK